MQGHAPTIFDPVPEENSRDCAHISLIMPGKKPFTIIHQLSCFEINFESIQLANALC